MRGTIPPHTDTGQQVSDLRSPGSSIITLHCIAAAAIAANARRRRPGRGPMWREDTEHEARG